VVISLFSPLDSHNGIPVPDRSNHLPKSRSACTVTGGMQNMPYRPIFRGPTSLLEPLDTISRCDRYRKQEIIQKVCATVVFNGTRWWI
jgi:hypothetical protein